MLPFAFRNVGNYWANEFLLGNYYGRKLRIGTHCYRQVVIGSYSDRSRLIGQSCDQATSGQDVRELVALSQRDRPALVLGGYPWLGGQAAPMISIGKARLKGGVD